MEQGLLMNHAGLQSLDSQIGVHAEDMFIIDDDCLNALTEISRSLDREDCETCLYRQQLYTYGILTKRLPSVLMSLDAEENDMLEDKEEIFHTVLGLLARLTQSLDLLIPDFADTQPECWNGHGQTLGVERFTRLSLVMKKLHTMVREVKEFFLTTSVARVIIEKMSEILEEVSLSRKLHMQVCEGLNGLFFLLRNLLNLPDQHNKHAASEMYSQSEKLVRLLLEVGLQKVVLFCTNSPQREVFALSLVQLVAAVFNKSENQFSENGGCTVGANSMASICETEEDLSPEKIKQNEAFQEFGKNLLEQGWPKMLFHVKALLVVHNKKNLSPLYYLWLLDFCLNRAIHHRMPFSTVRFLLSVYSVDYLVYLGVTSLEQMLLQQQKGENISKTAMHLSLVIKGLAGFFMALTYYSEADLVQEEKQYLHEVQCLLCQSRELRQSVLLLLRCHQREVHNVGHLAALVSLNHTYLMMADKLLDEATGRSYFDIGAHVKSYATKQVFQQYTELLQVPTNASATCVIEQVFTMLHHVTIDLGHKDLLLQLPLLQAISALESSPKCHKLSRNTVGLMRFALEEFYNEVKSDSQSFLRAMVSAPAPAPLRELMESGAKEAKTITDGREGSGTTQWNQSELEQLQDICVQCEEEDYFVESVIKEMHKLGLDKDESDIVDQMSHLNWQTDKETIADPVEKPAESKVDMDPLVQTLVAMGYQGELAWLQEVLLEIVYIKLGGLTLGRPIVEEPVTMHYIAQNQDIPLVPYTEVQESALLQPDFSSLLTTLGIRLNASGADFIFPRIPISWNVEKLLEVAESLQPINYALTKFTEEEVACSVKQSEFEERSQSTPMVTDSRSCNSSHSNTTSSDMWMLYVKNASRPTPPPTTKANGGGKKDSWWKRK